MGPTAHTPTASDTPFSRWSPRSSNATPAEVRASDRTVSETSTSPTADSPAIRDAMFTAPPYTLSSIARVEAEVEGEAGVAAGAGAGKRRFDRLAGAREYGEDAVAEELAFD